jgi:Cu/Ag efflux pump CusA
VSDGAFRDVLRRTLAPRSLALQAAGFAVGLAIVAWVVKGALDAANAPGRAGILESVRAAWDARPWLVAGIAITTVASLVPILWSTRPGAEVMKPLAVPVIGGSISSLIHILIVTPVLFLMIREWRRRGGERVSRGEAK